MLKRTAGKALAIGSLASSVFGLALVLALVVGVATAALAAVPGDPFRLGQTNTISNALTKIEGFRGGGSILTVDNNSSAADSRALDLRVEAGKPPLNVNADAGKATNLEADELDGLSAGEIGTNGVERISASSAFDSVSNKNPTAECPAGKVLVGTAYDTFGATSGSSPDQLTDVAVNSVVPTLTADGRDRVTAVAREEEPTSASWQVRVFAFCVTEGTP